MIATACADKNIRLWSAQQQQQAPLSTMYGSVDSLLCCAFSLDGKYVAASSVDSNCRIWNLSNGRIRNTLTGHKSKICAVEFSHDTTKVCTGSHDRSIKMWDMNKGDLLRTLLCISPVNGLDCCKTKDLLVSGHFDATLRF